MKKLLKLFFGKPKRIFIDLNDNALETEYFNFYQYGI